jgi:hypothetical protein
MSSYIPAALRQTVIERAERRCEYCLFPQVASFLTFEIEHIVAEKHHGQTIALNLALACPFCNRNKGTDLGSIDIVTERLTPFFNPRTQIWAEHFRIANNFIIGMTSEGRVTADILQFNAPDRLGERAVLIAAKRYP